MKIVTYNIRGGWGSDGVRSTERIAEVLLGLSPDIVLLQEVHQRLPQTKFVDQPSRLQMSLGMPLIFQANLRLGVGGYGVAVATRYPICQVQNHLLPSVREQRGVLQVTLEVEGEPLTVFCTHWGLSGAERERQAARLAELVRDVSGRVVVGGDFNERPDAAGIRSLLTQTGLSDADAAQNRLTYPADAPEARIDYFFYSPEITLLEVSPVLSLASDHFPLAAVFESASERCAGTSSPGGLIVPK